MPTRKEIANFIHCQKINITFKVGNFIWTRHTKAHKRYLAVFLFKIFHKRYSKQAMEFLEHEKTKDDSF